jgi:diguanylate cyclase (GGDEF)-like protein
MSNPKNSILLVDDEPMNITSLTHILKTDYTVYVEKDGAGCLEAARELKPDVILLDILMPIMNGFEVIKTLKNDEATRDIPVIFVTGLADYIQKPFSAAVVKLRVRNQIQIVNQMRIIHDISITDSLTGIGNRRYFYTQLEQEWQRGLRHQTPISFMMLDIDHFKAFNDTYGHLAGDVVLKETASIIKSCLSRAIDIVARWGGEEFIILLPSTPLDNAMDIANEIRKKVEEAEIHLRDKTITKVTISAGVNELLPNQASEINKFISDADKALYLAKGQGRNQVVANDSWN